MPKQAIIRRFFSQYLEEHEFFKYRQFKSQNEIARYAKKFFCPHWNSNAKIEEDIEVNDANNQNYKKLTLRWTKGHEFCSCGKHIHQNEYFHDENELKELLVEEKIKKCPKFGFLIKKKECNYMAFGNPIYKYEFFWLSKNGQFRIIMIMDIVLVNSFLTLIVFHIG